MPDERAFLASISPYHNLQSGREVSGSADLDDDEGRPRRSAARAQVRGEDDRVGIPYLFYEVIEGGHGAGANLRE